MSLWKKVWDGAVGAVASNLGIRHIENLCSEAGCSVAEHVGDKCIVIKFDDPLFRVREVLVCVGAEGDLGVITCPSKVKMDPDDLPRAVAYHLLHMNSKNSLYAFQMSINDDDTVTFAVSLTVIPLALTASLFQSICAAMVKEMREFDRKLRQAGLE